MKTSKFKNINNLQSLSIQLNYIHISFRLIKSSKSNDTVIAVRLILGMAVQTILETGVIFSRQRHM